MFQIVLLSLYILWHKHLWCPVLDKNINHSKVDISINIFLKIRETENGSPKVQLVRTLYLYVH